MFIDFKMNSFENINPDPSLTNEGIKKKTILDKAFKLLRRPFSIALLTTLLSGEALGQNKFELKKDNPQRQAYSGSYEDYQKYVESRRDIRKEREYKEREEQMIEYMIRNAGQITEAEENIKRFLEEGNTYLAEVEDKKIKELMEQNKRFSSFILNTNNNPKYKYERAKSVTEEDFQRIKERVSDSFKEADNQREWMVENVHSDEYERRLTENEKLSKEELEERKRLVLEDVNIEDSFNPLSDNGVGLYIEKGSSDDRRGQVTITQYKNLQQEGSTSIHELTHKATDGSQKMSLGAKELFLKLYDLSKDTTDRQEYIHKIEEVYARVKVFQYELEKLGIWTYGEIFTEEHLKKALDSKLLSEVSMEFLKDADVNVLQKIMNTIAMNNSYNDREIKEA